MEVSHALVESLVIFRLNYCSLLLVSLPLHAIWPQQVIQNLLRFYQITWSLCSLHWLPVAAYIRFTTYRHLSNPMQQYIPLKPFAQLNLSSIKTLYIGTQMVNMNIVWLIIFKLTCFTCTSCIYNLYAVVSCSNRVLAWYYIYTKNTLH